MSHHCPHQRTVSPENGSQRKAREAGRTPRAHSRALKRLSLENSQEWSGMNFEVIGWIFSSNASRDLGHNNLGIKWRCTPAWLSQAGRDRAAEAQGEKFSRCCSYPGNKNELLSEQGWGEKALIWNRTYSFRHGLGAHIPS